MGRSKMRELTLKLKNFIKNNHKILSIIIIVLLIGGGLCYAFYRGGYEVGYFTGTNSYFSYVDDIAVNKSTQRKLDLDTEFQDLRDEYQSLDKQVEEKQEVLKKAEEYETQSQEKEEHLSSLDSEIESKQQELDRINGELEARNAELEKVKGEPVTLSAGVYIVGRDIPAGVYDIEWVSGNGNCFTDVVNEIFGNRSDRYITKYKNAPLTTGEEVEIKGNLVLNCVPIS